MGRTRFVEESELARPGNPCPICGRPGAGEPTSKGVCRVSREQERLDEIGRTWLEPRGKIAYCFRQSAPVVPVGGGLEYRAAPNAGQDGTWYTLHDQKTDRPVSTLLRRSDGTPAKPRDGRDVPKRPRPERLASAASSAYTSKLDSEWQRPELTPDQAKSRQIALDIWAEREGGPGLALEYLASRGLDRAWLEQEWPACLGYSPRVYHGELRDRIPAMLCRIDDPAGEHASTHRIYLQPDGRGKRRGVDKAKWLIGSRFGGAARLYDPEPPGIAPGVLFLAEGIETAMAVAQAVRGGPRDAARTDDDAQLEGAGVWSCISAGGFAALVLPADLVRSGLIGRVVIAADVDASRLDEAGTQNGLDGQRAAARAQERLRAEYPGLAVSIAWPGMGVLTRWDEGLGHCVPGRGA